METSPKDSTFHGSLGLQNLESSIFDLLLAGSETTSTALTWATLFMIKFPHIQKKVQEEIDQVVGNSRLPENTDRLDYDSKYAYAVEDLSFVLL